MFTNTSRGGISCPFMQIVCLIVLVYRLFINYAGKTTRIFIQQETNIERCEHYGNVSVLLYSYEYAAVKC